MFANRYTAFVDACTLADSLRRNLILSLAEAEFFRVRWSEAVLDETQRAIEKIRRDRGFPNAAEAAAKARLQMEVAFEEAMVRDFTAYLPIGASLPDPGDAHVLAAALKIQAATIVTENVRDFPEHVVGPLDVEIRTADAFIADTIALDAGRAVSAIHQMRERLKAPALTPEGLLLAMEARGLTETVDTLKPFVQLL